MADRGRGTDRGDTTNNQNQRRVQVPTPNRRPQRQPVQPNLAPDSSSSGEDNDNNDNNHNPGDNSGTDSGSEDTESTSSEEDLPRYAMAQSDPLQWGMKRTSSQIHGLNRADEVPITRYATTAQESERQAKNTREATKTLRDRLKDENKKFDGSDIFGMVLFIIVAEEVLETYSVEDTNTSDMQSPDAVTVMFNNLQGAARD